MISRSCNVLIVGTGFAGLTIAKTLQRAGISPVLIDLGRSDGSPAIDFRPSSDSVFDVGAANSTARVGGGLGVWGGAVTPITVHNYLFKRGLAQDTLSEHVDNGWDRLRSRILETLPPTPILPRQTLGYPWSHRTNPSMERLSAHSLFAEKHFYSRRTPQVLIHQSAVSLRPERERFVTGSLNTIDRHGKFQWRLAFKPQPKGDLQEFVTDRLVFASGPLMNAALVSRLTSIRRFPIGNHLSTAQREVHFHDFRDYAPMAQTYSVSSDSFYTYSLDHPTRVRRGFGHSAGRLQPLPNKRRRALASQIAKSIGLSREFKMNLMADYGLRYGGEVEFEWLGHGRWASSISMPVPQQLLSELRYLDKKLVSWLESEGARVTALSGENQQAVVGGASPISLKDSAHYFGTVRVASNPSSSQVDSDQELGGHPGVFVVGASSLPSGNHSHPTAMSVALAQMAASKIIESFS